jgi:hypothetical protein
MKLTRCPICHADIALDALIQDDAGRGIMQIFLGMDKALGGAVVEYISLFRPAKTALSNVRMLALLEETLALEKNRDILIVSLRGAVAAAREKQAQGLWKQPKNHGWITAFIHDARVRQNLPPKAPKPTPLKDTPAQDARRENERNGTPMPAALKSMFTAALQKCPNETEEQRLARIDAARKKVEEISHESEKDSNRQHRAQQGQNRR